MGRLIDADKLIEYWLTPPMNIGWDDEIEDVNNQPTVEAIPKEEVKQFIESIQKIKDNHNEHGDAINYGTICGILIEGYRLLDKYMESKDGNVD